MQYIIIFRSANKQIGHFNRTYLFYRRDSTLRPYHLLAPGHPPCSAVAKSIADRSAFAPPLRGLGGDFSEVLTKENFAEASLVAPYRRRHFSNSRRSARIALGPQGFDCWAQYLSFAAARKLLTSFVVSSLLHRKGVF